MIMPHYKTTTTADDADADCDCDVNNGGFHDTQHHQPPGLGQGQRIITRQQQRRRQFKYYKKVVWLPIVVITIFLIMNRYHQLLKQTNLSFEELEYHDLYTYIEPPTAAAVVSVSSSSLFSSSSSTITTSSLTTTNSSSSSSSSSNSSSKSRKINWKKTDGTTTTTDSSSSSSSSKSIKINWKKKNGTTSKTTTATTRSAITSSSSSSPTTNSSSSNNSSKPLTTKKKKKKRKRKKKHTTTTTTDDEAGSFSYNTTSGFVLWRNYNASIMSDGNLMIEFFDSSTNNNNNNNDNNDDDDVKEQTQKAQTQQTNNNADGFSACLINLEDTIRLTEWIPYHYTILPLTSLVIAIDPKTSELGLNRTLELIELWKDRIQITVWPSYKLPPSKRYRPEQSYIRERQVYFANSCLKYHSIFTDRSWTLLTDNDEYLIYNYPHMNEYVVDDVDNGTTSISIDKGEYIHYDHPSYKKKKIQQEIELNRRKYMHWRFPTGNPNTNNTSNNNTLIENSTENNNNNTNNHSPNQNTLPMKLNQTIFQFIKQNQNILQLPICVRIPGIHYGGSVDDNDNAPAAAVSYLDSMSSPPPSSSSSSSLSWLTSLSSPTATSSTSSKSSVDNNILTTIDPTILSTYRYIYHEKRKSKFSKVMIDVSRIKTTTTSSNSNSSSSSTGHVLEWSKSNHAKTIHNPNRVLCGYNGVVDSGTDYYSSLFRVNHYIGSIQSYLERKDDYRSRSMELYHYKFNKIINVTKNPFYYDYDILPWMDLFINKCHNNITLVKDLLFRPLTDYNK